MRRPDLMQIPCDQFFLVQEGKVYFLTNFLTITNFLTSLRPDKPNQAVRLVPVDTNEEFEEELRADQENLERVLKMMEWKEQEIVVYSSAVPHNKTYCSGFS
jgi:hypothetical protein